MKVVVIGATGTIGAAVVNALAARTHEVVSASRHAGTKVDLEDAATIKMLFDRVHDVDGVVCCAGDAAFKPFVDLTDADYALSLRSKLMGQVTLATLATEHLRERGSITLTAGVLAREPMAGGVSVSLVNAGVEGFTRAAALELPRGLRINVVSPPWVAETLVKLGMDPAAGLAAADVAEAYVMAVEGMQQGAVIDPRRLS
jgi:NAD(P)-dependent dehydrogenase (short-subunit alcohol dehydrogenase family)